MTSSGASLREHLRRVGEVKARDAAEYTRAHLARPIGDRLLSTLRLGSECIRWRTTEYPQADHEAEAWARVADKLKRLASIDDPAHG